MLRARRHPVVAVPGNPPVPIASMDSSVTCVLSICRHRAEGSALRRHRSTLSNQAGCLVTARLHMRVIPPNSATYSWCFAIFHDPQRVRAAIWMWWRIRDLRFCQPIYHTGRLDFPSPFDDHDCPSRLAETRRLVIATGSQPLPPDSEGAARLKTKFFSPVRLRSEMAQNTIPP
jgi:hypothetical protein